MPLKIGRVVDHTDLIALAILPFTLLVPQHDTAIFSAYRRFGIPLVGMISIFSFCFTSRYNYPYYYTYNDQIGFYYFFKTDKSEEQIREQLHTKNIPFHIDSISYERPRYMRDNDEFVLKVKDPVTDSSTWRPLEAAGDSILYIRRKEKPFYIITEIQVDEYLLRNVKLSITATSKGRSEINILTFYIDDHPTLTNKMQRRFKTYFKQLLR
jgi:hypothetical protein